MEGLTIGGIQKQGTTEATREKYSAMCLWDYDRDAEMWGSGCGKSLGLIDGPESHEFEYCPFCGKPLAEI
jgi:hypothetical protein